MCTTFDSNSAHTTACSPPFFKPTHTAFSAFPEWLYQTLGRSPCQVLSRHRWRSVLPSQMPVPVRPGLNPEHEDRLSDYRGAPPSTVLPALPVRVRGELETGEGSTQKSGTCPHPLPSALEPDSGSSISDKEGPEGMGKCESPQPCESSAGAQAPRALHCHGRIGGGVD